LGSKSGTSAAIFTVKFSVSKCCTRRTPERPAINPSHRAGTPMPSGDTAPNPVTTTRFTLVPSLLPETIFSFGHQATAPPHDAWVMLNEVKHLG
jgi:hypothetical protein